MNELNSLLLEKASEWLLKYRNNVYASRCKGKIWNYAGKELVTAHGACHSWVSIAWHKARFDKKIPGFLILNCYNPKKNDALSLEENNAWIDWLCSPEMPLSEFIVNREDRDICRNGGVIIDCKAKDGILEAQSLWLCKAMRTAWEDPTVVRTWHKLASKHDIHPLFAYLVADCIRFGDGGIVLEHPSNSHASVWRYMKSVPPLEDIFGYVLSNSDFNSTNCVWHSGEKAVRYDYGSTYRNFFLEPLQKTTKIDDGWGNIISVERACKAQEYVDWLQEIQSKHIERDIATTEVYERA